MWRGPLSVVAALFVGACGSSDETLFVPADWDAAEVIVLFGIDAEGRPLAALPPVVVSGSELPILRTVEIEASYRLIAMAYEGNSAQQVERCGASFSGEQYLPNATRVLASELLAPDSREATFGDGSTVELPGVYFDTCEPDVCDAFRVEPFSLFAEVGSTVAGMLALDEVTMLAAVTGADRDTYELARIEDGRPPDKVATSTSDFGSFSRDSDRIYLVESPFNQSIGRLLEIDPQSLEVVETSSIAGDTILAERSDGAVVAFGPSRTFLLGPGGSRTALAIVPLAGLTKAKFSKEGRVTAIADEALYELFEAQWQLVETPDGEDVQDVSFANEALVVTTSDTLLRQTEVRLESVTTGSKIVFDFRDVGTFEDDILIVTGTGGFLGFLSSSQLCQPTELGYDSLGRLTVLSENLIAVGNISVGANTGAHGAWGRRIP